MFKGSEQAAWWLLIWWLSLLSALSAQQERYGFCRAQHPVDVRHVFEQGGKQGHPQKPAKTSNFVQSENAQEAETYSI